VASTAAAAFSAGATRKVLGFAAGLFIGHPELFLDSRRVIAAITRETMKYASLQEFNANKLLNLSLIWQYISYLIPFAMYPFLWLLPTVQSYILFLGEGGTTDPFLY
jgi:hypothetical protein